MNKPELYLCLTCGEYGSQTLGQAWNFLGETLQASFKGKRVDPMTLDCPDGHGPMHKVEPGDRLSLKTRITPLEETEDGR